VQVLDHASKEEEAAEGGRQFATLAPRGAREPLFTASVSGSVDLLVG